MRDEAVGEPDAEPRPRIGGLVLALLGLGLATLLGPAPQADVAGGALVLGALALGFAHIAETAGRRRGRHRRPDAKRKP